MTRHLLPVVFRMTEIHFRPRDDHDRRVFPTSRRLCLMYEQCYSWSGKRSRQTRHFALYMSLARESISSWTAVAAVAPEAEGPRNASRVRSDWELCGVLE